MASKLYSTFWLARVDLTETPSQLPSTQNSHSLRLPKHLQKYTLYTYLKQPDRLGFDLALFFTPNQAVNITNSYALRQLFQTISAVKGSGHSTTQLSLTNLLTTGLTPSTVVGSKVSLWANNDSLLTTHTHLLLNYYLLVRAHRKSSEQVQPTPTNLTALNRWNLYTITPETLWKGNFYINELNLNTLNSFSSASKYTILWSDAVREVVQSTKSQYWLYKYSTLHRAVFKNTHTLTVTKRLIGSGFFDSKLTKSNLWAANEMRATANYTEFQERNKATMGLLYNSSKGFTDTLSVTNTLSTAGTDLSSLGLYQKSFDWFLTRSYHFSGLQSSLLSSGYKLASEVALSGAPEDSQGELRRTLASYLKAFTLSNNIYVGQSNVPNLSFEELNSSLPTLPTSGSSYTNRDLYLFYSSQSAYNTTILQALTSLLQRHTSQSKRLHYSTVASLSTHNTLNTYSFDTGLQVIQADKTNQNLSSRLTTLEILFLQDLASATVYSQK